jgi:hypothetical protein
LLLWLSHPEPLVFPLELRDRVFPEELYSPLLESVLPCCVESVPVVIPLPLCPGVLLDDPPALDDEPPICANETAPPVTVMRNIDKATILFFIIFTFLLFLSTCNLKQIELKAYSKHFKFENPFLHSVLPFKRRVACFFPNFHLSNGKMLP